MMRKNGSSPLKSSRSAIVVVMGEGQVAARLDAEGVGSVGVTP